jgi:hypothetical protein
LRQRWEWLLRRLAHVVALFVKLAEIHPLQLFVPRLPLQLKLLLLLLSLLLLPF